MAGIGMIFMYIGFATATWGVNSFQGNPQAPFIQQIFPFVPQTGAVSSTTSAATAPAGTKGPVGTTVKKSVGNLGKTNPKPTGLQGPQTGLQGPQS